MVHFSVLAPVAARSQSNVWTGWSLNRAQTHVDLLSHATCLIAQHQSCCGNLWVETYFVPVEVGRDWEHSLWDNGLSMTPKTSPFIYVHMDQAATGYTTATAPSRETFTVRCLNGNLVSIAKTRDGKCVPVLWDAWNIFSCFRMTPKYTVYLLCWRSKNLNYYHMR